MRGVFLKEFFENEEYGFKIVDKGHILKPFSGTLKTLKNVTKFKGRLCVQRGIVFTIFDMGYGSVKSPIG